MAMERFNVYGDNIYIDCGQFVNFVKAYDERERVFITMTKQDVDDIITDALEGGYTADWCMNVNVVDDEYLGEYASEQISRGGQLEFHLIEPMDDSGKMVYTLTLEKFLNGVARAFENIDIEDFDYEDDGREVYISFDTASIDAMIADNIIQYAVLDDLVFG